MLLRVVKETDAGIVVRGAKFETAAAYANQAFTKPTILRLVIVPQVFRIILPTLGNQIVSVVLGSAQASIIGVGAQVISLL
jgi:ABC-type amino acid transport system permease subunit